jgi:hypothetical protein
MYTQQLNLYEVTFEEPYGIPVFVTAVSEAAAHDVIARDYPGQGLYALELVDPAAGL